MRTETFTCPLHDGDTITRGKFTLTARIHHDTDHGAPWDEEDGHGPVSDWRCADSKQAGELVLHTNHSKARFYDYAEACRIALRDGWDAAPYNEYKSETPRQQAAKAALADYNRLRQWCGDQWSYVGVMVECSQDDIQLGEASLWGIESDCDDYLAEVANELCDEALEEAREAIARLATA